MHQWVMKHGLIAQKDAKCETLPAYWRGLYIIRI